MLAKSTEQLGNLAASTAELLEEEKNPIWNRNHGKNTTY